MNRREQAFVDQVWKYYRSGGRHDLPWRKTRNSYRILVSEVMLQQTQVDRVLPRYQAFLKQFPTARRLAAAPLGEVLKVWQGLGYNRRAKFLQQAVRLVVDERGGRWPKDEVGLQLLPGVGPYTAGAVAAFAYNQPVVLIETNVRQVFLHHFFRRKTEVSDADILKLIEKTLPKENPREWYWALMDYGAHLKQQHGNLGHQSKHYIKQSKFHGSNRQLRGIIIKILTKAEHPLTRQQLQQHLVEVQPRPEAGRVASQLASLTREDLVQNEGTHYQLKC